MKEERRPETPCDNLQTAFLSLFLYLLFLFHIPFYSFSPNRFFPFLSSFLSCELCPLCSIRRLLVTLQVSPSASFSSLHSPRSFASKCYFIDFSPLYIHNSFPVLLYMSAFALFDLILSFFGYFFQEVVMRSIFQVRLTSSQGKGANS